MTVEERSWHNPHAVYRRGQRWSVGAAPGRLLAIDCASQVWWPRAVGFDSADDVRALAAALIELADLIEQPDPTEETP